MRMRLLSNKTVEDAIAEVAQVAQYNEVLHTKDFYDEAGNPIATPGQLLFQGLMEPTHCISGKGSHDYDWMNKCTNIPSPLEELTEAELCKLYEFLSSMGSTN